MQDYCDELFLRLFDPSIRRGHEAELVRDLPQIIREHGITKDTLSQGLYLAAQHKYFQCVKYLVRECGAVFHSFALVNLLRSDQNYTLEDVMNVVDAVGADGGGGLEPNATFSVDGRTILHIYCAKLRRHALGGITTSTVDLGVVKRMVEWGVNPSAVETLERISALGMLEQIMETPADHRQLSPRDVQKIQHIIDYLKFVSMHLRPHRSRF